ncbi:MAG: tRNA (N6-isopentenyl adenosine(37)-C2)-methylthiotransferase MiaB, partial [Epsilonproteobacteria bacterium]|nr:tRNA (N6-isopentenyl adenosine(37)-C2)-methylthiotransferase MiaB [Campylobacterota bacterium]NPA89088.1 tRNA (N6-isopentenyl adenosine(37)-C2)-methylthiotransferase MiaB [Campylobacterota bacterium]
MKKRLFIQTFGCQMNVKDSEHIIGELEEEYQLTDNPREADLIIVNTCSVREKPVQKLFSELGALRKVNPSARFGVCGCTASHMGEEILKRAPFVSFVLGARNVSRIREVVNQNGAVVTDLDFDDTTYPYKNWRKYKFKDFVNIMVGCDKKCTYCIVPKTRGKELSIPMDLILKRVEELAQDGVKEITLLGQNVNNYGKRFSQPHPKVDFTDLLREVTKIDGIERVRFTSPHPLHADDRFLEEFATNPKICKHIHFPLQSGSNKILKLMKRGYTKEWFLNRISKLRQIPDVAISTDIIVAFPGENEEDFQETLEVVEKAQFEQIFSFLYSPRPLTEAIHLPNRVPKEVGKERLYRLQNLHRQILEENQTRHIGKIYPVLVEEPGMGKSDNFFTIKFTPASPQLVGEIVKVKITS